MAPCTRRQSERRRIRGVAAAALVAIPMALLYNVFLDRFISGFTLGAVKG